MVTQISLIANGSQVLESILAVTITFYIIATQSEHLLSSTCNIPAQFSLCSTVSKSIIN